MSNSYTSCFAMEHRPGEDHSIDKPQEYSFWRDYKPELKPAWTGKLLDWTASNPVTLKARTMAFDPECDEHGSGGGWWLHRRIARKRNFTPGAYPSDITSANWPQNDYWLDNIQDVSLLYWMQTEAGWKGLRLRPEGDSVGLGSYRIDLHPSSGGDNYVDIGSLPFQIPLGALIPKRVENLLAAAKNLGVTHITSGCYRLHPVELNVGESAGLLAAETIRIGERRRRIRNSGNPGAQIDSSIIYIYTLNLWLQHQ